MKLIYLTFCRYYSGEKVAPILTIFIGGNHEASNYLQELPYGGWVAPNIYYLGYAGVVNVNGIRIGGISGKIFTDMFKIIPLICLLFFPRNLQRIWLLQRSFWTCSVRQWNKTKCLSCTSIGRISNEAINTKIGYNSVSWLATRMLQLWQC